MPQTLKQGCSSPGHAVVGHKTGALPPITNYKIAFSSLPSGPGMQFILLGLKWLMISLSPQLLMPWDRAGSYPCVHGACSPEPREILTVRLIKLMPLTCTDPSPSTTYVSSSASCLIRVICRSTPTVSLLNVLTHDMEVQNEGLDIWQYRQIPISWPQSCLGAFKISYCTS